MPEKPPSLSYPTPFQRKTGWIALTAFNVVLIAAIGVGSIWLVSWVLGYLQPILVPMAVAGILTYLLEPIVLWLQRRGWTHKWAVLTVFVAFNLAAVVLLLLVLLPAIDQGLALTQPEKLQEAQTKVSEFTTAQLDKIEQGFPGATAEARRWLSDGRGLSWAGERMSAFGGDIWNYLTSSLAKVFGIIGYVLGLLLVPVYLYFFLKNSTAIANQWGDYVPLWQSEFKDEVVSTLKEINGYIIAYFRGQMLVSIIDGVVVGLALWAIGLDSWLLIGVFLAILGVIPYVGNLIVLIPTLLIAIAQFGDHDPAWLWPTIVLGIFVVVQQVNGLVTAPKIVGESVGLHPLTVIFSMLFWSLLMGGVLGALLAVPLTASLKVLFQRYVWKTRLKPGVESRLNLTKPEPG